jgi:hypothetical protein
MQNPFMVDLHVVVLDESLRTRLHNLNGIVKLCDESGEVVGHVVPNNVPGEILDGLRKCPDSEKELERSRQETGGRTLEEILKDLQELP